ncbi:gastrula zinc finger protein XlCGF57.1 isoform X3 [Etheostoma spectabile]|uniref:gastrula zinc finger protein XlCGF57.1 isoform X3 n=1 Tax=Etheostoma spectabile TaxID=54343 RepID=UPI0013AED6F8|nr:gastrula zinc finger protein XlCGF57.1-like isoform X3 [Etheostoma spectabile]
MSSIEYLREFVNERLTAAAEEIFGVFERTIVEYEEEIDRQRRLLDIVWKPEIKLLRIELQQQHVSKEEEEVTADQPLCIQEWNSSLDQEEPEPPQIKEEQEEQEELCTSQEGEQLELKQETDAFMLTPTYEKSDHSEDQTLYLSTAETLSVMEKTPLSYIWDIKSDHSEPEPNTDHQLLSHISHEAESQDQKGGEHGDSRNAEPEKQNQHHKSNLVESQCNTHTGKMYFKCDTCEKDFKYRSLLQRHLSVHTGEKPYSCETCGKDFKLSSALTVHMRMHTGEKPYTCETCGKDFRRNNELVVHMRTHTGEKPYLCKTCRKTFCDIKSLKRHMGIHTGEKPYTCETCGKDFRRSDELIVHMRIHTGEKPYVCKTCGKAFRQRGDLTVHIRTHTGEKPFTCKTCGKGYRCKSGLLVHMRRAHTSEKP